MFPTRNRKIITHLLNILGMGGLFTLSKLVSLEMAPIRCNVVAPGPVHTEIFERMPGGEEYLKSFQARTTIGRVPGPHDT